MPKKIIKTEKHKDISLGQYQHTKNKRANNPQVGLVSSALDSKPKKKTYQHDPYIDPTLSWAGKTEGTSFDVDTVSLHIHERIDPKRIIKQVLKKTPETNQVQPSLFEQPSENFNTEKEFDFYSHTKNWSNRLIAGDSLLVMNSLLEKENMAGKVQMIYIDPPYGIKYNSNFQPFTNKKDVKDKDDDSIPAEPEMIKAFRDTWELGIHSYLTYLRDRLLLSKELLHETGSIFVQINEINLHLVRNILDEIFGKENFISNIQYITTTAKTSNYLPSVSDYIIWYAKDKNTTKYRQMFIERDVDNNYFKLRDEKGWYYLRDLTSQGSGTNFEFEFDGKIYKPNSNRHWSFDVRKIDKSRLQVKGSNVYGKVYFDDFPVALTTNNWSDTALGFQDKIYIVQSSVKAVQRCLLMTTDPGDLVLDITCGSGTTAFVAEQWGRRWITCDTSRVAIQLAKQRLMTAKFDYYEMAQSEEGVSSGFKYKTVPHITLGSIANNELAKEETLYDQPIIVKNKVRVTGPFTVEAVPGIR
ncbi:MAG TPA: site-specific DNA-methyltransferase, partial [Candidatus Paceibacterota bacterium]|nr:site-specific DNA-methyltransferase [Candidatus Paceibacterota bacterium]